MKIVAKIETPEALKNLDAITLTNSKYQMQEFINTNFKSQYEKIYNIANNISSNSNAQLNKELKNYVKLILNKTETFIISENGLLHFLRRAGDF